MIDPIVSGFADAALKCYSTQEVITVYEYMHCDKKIQVNMDLPPEFELAVDNPFFNEALIILGHSLNGIYEAYSNNNVFTEPQLLIKPVEKIIGVKIGILSKDRWNRILQSRSKEP